VQGENKKELIYTFTSAGDFFVCLGVKDSCGFESTYSQVEVKVCDTYEECQSQREGSGCQSASQSVLPAIMILAVFLSRRKIRKKKREGEN